MPKIKATIVNHGAIDIARPASVIWSNIVEDIFKSGSFLRQGFCREQVDDPAAIDAGRLRRDQDGKVDEMLYRITEYDEQAMRLSAHAESSSGLTAFVTYQALPTDSGGRYLIDSHSVLDVDVAPGASRADVAASVAAQRDRFDFASRLAALKAEMEGVAPGVSGLDGAA